MLKREKGKETQNFGQKNALVIGAVRQGAFPTCIIKNMKTKLMRMYTGGLGSGLHY